MGKQFIAIVGLGRVGSAFFKELLDQSNSGVEIVAVVEPADTPGRVLAKTNGIRNVRIDELVAMGDGLDIIFDLTDAAAVRQELREKLHLSGNRHTIVATENIARMIMTLISSGVDLPKVHTSTGY
jgi:predicted dinucleotide-utilizing enzyme